jgi:hypothetical protein
MTGRDGRRYSTWRRPFRLQLGMEAAQGFTAPASRGRCQFEGGCGLFEWCTGARYCRDHWLHVYGKTELPERSYGHDVEGV